MGSAELVACVREAFGWGEDVVVSAGPRGALGQIWRLEVGSARYALKEIFANPPTEALIEAELAFARRAAQVGVQLPACHPDREGHHLLATPGGRWLRLYDWVDLRPVDLSAPATPRELGALLARLHRCGLPSATEPDGGTPDPWYDQAPAAHAWTQIPGAGALAHASGAGQTEASGASTAQGSTSGFASGTTQGFAAVALPDTGPVEASGVGWTEASGAGAGLGSALGAGLGSGAGSVLGAEREGRLGELLGTLSELCAVVAPVDPGELIVCHRDLHPENVLADPTGALVVVDWDNLGPAVPSRELARALFDWFCDRTTIDLDAVRDMYESYVGEGGPGRITGPADFSMLIASRLNFLQRQLRIAHDPQAEPRHREWAEREIDETLHIVPTPKQLADVLRLTRTRA